MTLPVSGPISFLDIIEELDGSRTPRPISLNDTDVRSLAGKPSGRIAFSDLHGKSTAGIIIDMTCATFNSDYTGYEQSLGHGVVHSFTPSTTFANTSLRALWGILRFGTDPSTEFRLNKNGNTTLPQTTLVISRTDTGASVQVPYWTENENYIYWKEENGISPLINLSDAGKRITFHVNIL